MDSLGKNARSETQAHVQLKRLALLWAQANGYSACAVEVSLPRCRYRADLAAYRPEKGGRIVTAIFECKQAHADLRRDNGCAAAIRTRLQSVDRRRQILEKNLRVHYPALRMHESLFAEFDSHNFALINHRGYRQITRQISSLQNRLFDCTKFETLVRYGCANLHFVVLPLALWVDSEVPLGWGALVEKEGQPVLLRRPVWQQVSPESQRCFLERIASCATRSTNRQFEITFDHVQAMRAQCLT